MSGTKTCGKCGTEMLEEAAGGLCPRCLMAMNFDSRTMPEEEAPPKAAALSPGEMKERFPQFDILECLGRGGMGVVYKARQKTLDRMVAIKVLAGEWRGEPGFASRFEKEAKTLAQMNHPNIVTVHDFGEIEGLYYIVMEFVDGVNLRDVLKEGAMPPEQALAIVPPICDALQYAHDKGVVHRDIKPENLLLDRDGRIKIADFGIASLIGAEGESAGTPPYMAPEQSGAATGVDSRADIYALGVVLYEMLTGERPNKELIAPSKKVSIDVRLDEIVLRALEMTPELRYQTAGEFRTVLETMAQSSPNPDIKPQPPFDQSRLTQSPAIRTGRFWHYTSPGAFLLAYAGLLLLLVATANLLPTRVASHFGAEGKPDGWMNRGSYLALVGCMPLLFGGLAVLITWLTHRLPARFINIPRRDFWLTPERKPETAAFLRHRLFWLAVLMTLFFNGLHVLTVQANQSTPAHLSLDGLLALIIAFMLALMVWIVFLLMRLAQVDKPLPKAAAPTVPPAGSTAKRHPWPIWLTFGIHALMLVGLAGILMVSVPRFMATFRDFDLELPLLTQLVIGVAEFTMRGGYLLVPVLMAMNLLLCWSADKFGGRKLLAGWAVLGMLVLLGLGVFIVGSLFLTTSHLIGFTAESSPSNHPLPAEFSWRKVAVPSMDRENWESTGTDAVLKPVVRIDQPGVSARRYAVIGEIKYENIEGTAYLEMWNHFQPSGSYFTRTLAPPGSGPMAVITASSDWRAFTLPFDRSGTAGPLSKLEVNLHLPAKGKVYLRGLRVVEDAVAPAPQPIRPAPLTPIPPEAAVQALGWGVPDQGASVQLRADKAQWTSGEIPSLKMDLRNQGNLDLTTLQSQEFGRLEVDGISYRWTGACRLTNSPFPPGHVYTDIPITLGAEWMQARDRVEPTPPLRLRLAPGSHVVRFAPTIGVPGGAKSGKGPSVSCISNPVEIEITTTNDPATVIPMAWGEPINGVAVHLQADLTTWTTDESPVVTAHVRNHGTSALPLSIGPIGNEVEVDGKWHQWHPAQGDRPSQKLAPGAECAINLTLSNAWQSQSSPLALSVGQHVIRFAIQTKSTGGTEVVRVISNSIRLDIAEGIHKRAALVARYLPGYQFRSVRIGPAALEEVLLAPGGSKVNLAEMRKAWWSFPNPHLTAFIRPLRLKITTPAVAEDITHLVMTVLIGGGNMEGWEFRAKPSTTGWQVETVYVGPPAQTMEIWPLELILQDGLLVDVANAAEARLEPMIIHIHLAADGALTVADQPCPLDQLVDRIKGLAGAEVVSVKLQADKNTPYRKVQAVLEACSAAGIKDIAFSAEKP